ncbi:MAG TPA: hypothetical protein VHN15_03920 [Thermoanaerobaculia bacterium]|nr:hypothetical protein [Thermoanaerobaculia bacterium]
MSRFNRSLPFLSVGLLALGACQDDPSPTSPLPPSETVPSTATAPLRETLERPHEAAFHKIAGEIKSFGGYHYDPEGNLVAYLADGAEADRARSILEGVLKSRDLSRRERAGGQVVLRKGQFSFLELAAWRDRSSDQVLDTEGVEFTDLDEAQNRLVVGISRGASRESVAKVLAEHGVPEEAVLYEETEPVVEEITLRDKVRPLEGGLQIQRSDGGTCTLGFNAYWNGYNAFLTNSHCTNAFWKTDGVSVYQNVVSGTNLVGYELYDKAPSKCGFLWIYDCRWSDAAVIRRYGTVKANHGKIARTLSWATGNGNSGSITINPNAPRMTIVGEYAFPTGGEMMDKMGRTTGWTYGHVKKTCVDVNKSGLRRVWCQDFNGNMHSNNGDSGSPVFRWYGSTVKLAGIHWGRITQGGTTYRIMSAMWNIEKDLGALGTF